MQYHHLKMCSEGFVKRMAYKIQITDSFENELNLVTAYISQVLQNPDAAAHLVDEAEKTVGLISDYPSMF